MYQSARNFLGLPVLRESSPTDGGSVLGIIETVTINPNTYQVDGFLLGRVGLAQNQVFLARECIKSVSDHEIRAHARLMRKPAESRRIIGLSAWTIQPRVLVGFVHDFYFSPEDGFIESFVIHQLIRTWRIPTGAVEKITSRALLIRNDTTIKLKITPFPSEAV